MARSLPPRPARRISYSVRPADRAPACAPGALPSPRGGGRMGGEPSEQGAQPLAGAAHRIEATDLTGLHLPGSCERPVPEQARPRVISRVTARDPLHHVAADLVPVS